MSWEGYLEWVKNATSLAAKTETLKKTARQNDQCFGVFVKSVVLSCGSGSEGIPFRNVVSKVSTSLDLWTNIFMIHSWHSTQSVIGAFLFLQNGELTKASLFGCHAYPGSCGYLKRARAPNISNSPALPFFTGCNVLSAEMTGEEDQEAWWPQLSDCQLPQSGTFYIIEGCVWGLWSLFKILAQRPWYPSEFSVIAFFWSARWTGSIAKICWIPRAKTPKGGAICIPIYAAKSREGNWHCFGRLFAFGSFCSFGSWCFQYLIQHMFWIVTK